MVRQSSEHAWPYPVIFAHRGAGVLAPENTLAAMQIGYELGFKAVEFDTMLTQDAIAILMHDPQLGRTISGQGSIANFSLQQLKNYDAGAWFKRDESSPFIGERIPTLAEVLLFCYQKNIMMNVEIKPVEGFECATGKSVAESVAQFCAAHPSLQPLPLFSSFSLEALEAAYEVAPQLPRGILFSRLPDAWQYHAERLECLSIHCNHQHLTKAQAKAIKGQGYRLFCYTVNDLDRAKELIDWQVDSFCTDRLDIFSEFSSKEERLSTGIVSPRVPKALKAMKGNEQNTTAQ
ncbi:MAG: glycerophosphodiester phosphodiesterase [Pseudomonadota bacterium]